MDSNLEECLHQIHVQVDTFQWNFHLCNMGMGLTGHLGIELNVEESLFYIHVTLLINAISPAFSYRVLYVYFNNHSSSNLGLKKVVCFLQPYPNLFIQKNPYPKAFSALPTPNQRKTCIKHTFLTKIIM